MTEVNKPKDTSAPTDDALARAAEHYALGRKLWAEGRHGEAITQYNHAVALDPQSPAATALQMATGIMDFYDKSRYNP